MNNSNFHDNLGYNRNDINKSMDNLNVHQRGRSFSDYNQQLLSNTKTQHNTSKDNNKNLNYSNYSTHENPSQYNKK
jgi:hypothetical protein